MPVLTTKSNHMKQTAVDWLIDWMGKNQYFIGNDLLEAYKQAKEMEKEQIKTAYYDGMFDEWDTGSPKNYYNETFDNDLVPYNTLCGCNPANGGNGVCGCTMGNKMVDKRVDYGTNNWTNYSTNTTY